MRKYLIATVGALSLATSANAATVSFGGRFYPGFGSGYVDADPINQYSPVHDDTGLLMGDLVNFSHAPIAPAPIEVTFDTPNYGEVVGDFSYLIDIHATPAGVSFELGGTLNNSGQFAYFSVDLVNPWIGVPPSFSVFGTFAYTPPPIDPPPCVSCDPPPPCLTCGPVGPAAPELSTWAMMGLGFAGLAFAGYRRQTTSRLSTLV